MFTKADFTRMAEVLAALKGRFIMSLNDRPEVREIFAGFQIEGVGTHYGLAGRGAQAAQEVVISG
jgi:DNA adenine methylase